MIKAFAFDLDGTLTQHRTPIEEQNRKILEKLNEKYALVMVGAGGAFRIHNQLGGFPIDVIGNYGMQYAKYENGKLTIKRDESCPPKDKKTIEYAVAELRKKHGFTEFSGNSVEYHDSGCLTFPILGTSAKIENKLSFDPTRKKRRAIYSEVCDFFPDYNVFVGGSSSFDMAPKPFNKYYALDLWCRENGFSHDEVVFVGDDYGLGGNDESIYLSDFRFITIDNYTHLAEVLAPWIDEDQTDVTSLLGAVPNCACGKKHTCGIKRVVVRNGAIQELPAIAHCYRKILIVCDKNTRIAAANQVYELLSDKTETILTYEDELLVPNEKAVEKLSNQITEETDLIIGVGSGVINDLCKYCSHKANLPYYIVATAPSMDGYASKGAAMIFGGMKITENAAVPEAIIADTAVLKNAPLEMLKAGYGDIIGKYSCLNDWKLSATVNSEYLCSFIYNLTYKTVVSVSNMGKAIISRNEDSIAALMRALIIVGIAMAYMGNSRPASGSEHHISHYFEVVGLLREEPYFCHGIDVAYATYLTSQIRRDLLKIDTPLPKHFDLVEWEREISRVYRAKEGCVTSNGIISLQKNLGWIFKNRIDGYKEKWNEIKEILKESPSPEEILQMLESVNLSVEEFCMVYSEEKRADAILYAKDLKDIYTALWLYNDLKF